MTSSRSPTRAWMQNGESDSCERIRRAALGVHARRLRRRWDGLRRRAAPIRASHRRSPEVLRDSAYRGDFASPRPRRRPARKGSCRHGSPLRRAAEARTRDVRAVRRRTPRDGVANGRRSPRRAGARSTSTLRPARKRTTSTRNARSLTLSKWRVVCRGVGRKKAPMDAGSSDSVKLRQALRTYFVENGFGEDGGYAASWVDV